jgi:tRNA pseudouridine55 synthase
MIILVGEECKNKEKYLDYDKEYEIEIIFGFSTDSYDVLGLVNENKRSNLSEINLNKYIGKFEQKYPRYSSKVIAMKEVPDEMPIREVEIYSIEDLGKREIKGSDMIREIINKISLVKGDFRQNEITARWSSISEEIRDSYFTILKLRVRCSSGTYMRTLAHNIGNDIGIPALAYSIKRLFLLSSER